MNIPILPIAIDSTIPDQMIQELHALRWDGTDEEKNFRINNYVSVLEIEKSRPLYEFADYQEDRTEMMVELAKNITILGFHGKIRQMAGLSSFHIPREPIYYESWMKRYDGQEMPSHYIKDLLRKERLILERHVENEGCSLIINSDFEFGSEISKHARLDQLIAFLKVRRDQDNINIVIDEIPPGRNLTIVGDWFFADAFKATLDDGYFQTIFSRHAPTVRKKIIEFDHRFEKLLEKQGTEKSSVDYTINKLEEIKNELI